MTKPRHFLTMLEMKKEEINKIIASAGELKKLHKQNSIPPLLDGKVLGMIFQKPSTRTRTSFEAGMFLLGGHAIYLDNQTSQMKRGEDNRDTALTLSQYTNGIMARVYEQKTLEELSQYSTVPVINGLSNQLHPCQILSDLFTIHEHFGKTKEIELLYVGVPNNVSNSLALASGLMGMHFTISAPSTFPPDKKIINEAKKLAKKSGGSITTQTGIPEKKELKKINIVYTDEWESMHMKLNEKMEKPLYAFQVNEKLLSNCAPNSKMMHCLPASKGKEVNSTIMYGKKSLVWTQAQNRLYAQQALLLTLLRN